MANSIIFFSEFETKSETLFFFLFSVTHTRCPDCHMQIMQQHFTINTRLFVLYKDSINPNLTQAQRDQASDELSHGVTKSFYPICCASCFNTITVIIPSLFALFCDLLPTVYLNHFFHYDSVSYGYYIGV